MRNIMTRVFEARPGWPRAAFAALVAACGAMGVACAYMLAPPMDRYLPAAAAVVLAALAVRVWIGEVPEDDPDEDLIY